MNKNLGKTKKEKKKKEALHKNVLQSEVLHSDGVAKGIGKVYIFAA